MWYAAANTFGLTLRLSGGYDDDQKFTTPSKAKRETLFEVQNSYTLAIVYSRVVGFDQLFRNPPSKPSNVQVDEGLLETNFDLKAVTTSSFEMKLLDCPQLYPQGQLIEVPMFFEIFTEKVDVEKYMDMIY